MRTFWGALLDPSERPWALPVFLGVWTLVAIGVILTGGRGGWF